MRRPCWNTDNPRLCRVGFCGALALSSLAASAQDSASTERLGPLELAVFVDAYAAWQTNGRGTLAALSEHRSFSGQGSTLRSENGFSIAFLGLDAEYDAGDLGVVANLRFGQAARIFHAESDLPFGVDHLTQAYALYRPVKELELDLGMFLSPFGFESLESWKNPNYTISALYVYGQPNWHMGLKAQWELNDSLSFIGMVVNGVNNISETQDQGGLYQTPSVGGSATWRATPALSFALGALVPLDQAHADPHGFDVFGDFVSILQLDALTAALNVDYIYTRGGAPGGGDRHFIGGSLTSGYHLSDMFGIAARAEYLRDDANYDGRNVWTLVAATLTLEAKPIPEKPFLIVRWENRWERSNQRVFGKDSRGTEDTADDAYRRSWFESVLGVVVTTNL